ncbi:uncharacterized protein METZ01_LOCUS492360 [marine metagenome]|uniref:Histidine kinase/HSP90-like ATPase domain-containing protein n=1 Tax=marine metagenome TaxID=408172 RepID=A0A383D4N8_9ZZZZ
MEFLQKSRAGSPNPFIKSTNRGYDTNHYGLGLNLCKTIIEAHNRTIWVENEAGSESTFILEFPISRHLSK